jgi:hypothetical protein
MPQRGDGPGIAFAWPGAPLRVVGGGITMRQVGERAYADIEVLEFANQIHNAFHRWWKPSQARTLFDATLTDTSTSGRMAIR